MTRDEALTRLSKSFDPYGTKSEREIAFADWLTDFMQETYTNNSVAYNEGCANGVDGFWNEPWSTSFRRLVDENFFTEQQKDEIYCRFILAGLHRDDDSNRAASEASVTS